MFCLYEMSAVSIPHRYATNKYKRQELKTMLKVSIPHRYATNFWTLNILPIEYKVSIPHRYATNTILFIYCIFKHRCFNPS